MKLWVAFESTSRSLRIQIISVRPHWSLFFRRWNWRLPCCDIWPICACHHGSHDSTVLFQKNGAVTLLILNDCLWISHNFPLWWHFLASPFARSVGLWFLFQKLPEVLHYLRHRSNEDSTILPAVFIHVLGSERSYINPVERLLTGVTLFLGSNFVIMFQTLQTPVSSVHVASIGF